MLIKPKKKFWLPGIAPYYKAAASSAFAINYGGLGTNLTSQTTYPISGITIPVTGAGVYLVAVVGIRSGSAISAPTVTIDPGSGSTTANLVTGSGALGGTGPASYCGIFINPTPVTSGSTATVIISAFGSAAARAAVALYTVTTSNNTGTGSTDAANANPTQTLTVTSGGGIIAGELIAAGGSSTTTNMTQDQGATVGASYFANAHDTSHAGASTAYTFNNTGTSGNGAASFAYWGP